MSAPQPSSTVEGAAGVTPAATSPLIEVDDLQVHYKVGDSRHPLRAVDGVTFTIGRGETFGLIGESGSGKSTIARAIMRLAPIAGGSITVDGQRIDGLKGGALRRARQRVQMVFQDPSESLDPRMTIRQSIAEPLTAAGRRSKDERRERVAELVNRVGLDPHHAERRPHALSGGQKQRVNVARALALEPEMLICDEAVSALDVSVQAGILNLLLALQADLGLSYLFISHDIGVVAHVADRVGVMYLGVLVEVAPTASLVSRPRHPYTEALLAAEPEPLPSELRTGRHDAIAGDIPSPIDPPSGCRFRTRCPYAEDRCADEVPPLRPLDDHTYVACHFAESLQLEGRRSAAPSTTPPVSARHQSGETT